MAPVKAYDRISVSRGARVLLVYILNFQTHKKLLLLNNKNR